MPSTSSTSTTLRTINPWFERRPEINRASEATRCSIGFVSLRSVIWTDKLSLHHPLRQSGVKLYPSATVSLEFPALYPIPGIQLAKQNGNANDGKCEGGLGRVELYYATRPSLSFVFLFFFFQSAATIALFSIALHFTTSTPGTTLASIFVLAWFFDYLYSFFFPQYSIKMCFKRA